MSFYEELKRRNIFRVGVAYVAISWVILQAVDVVLNNVSAPVWIFQTLLLVLAIGFIPTLLFSWAFEVTPEGIKRESDVDRSDSAVSKAGRKLTLIIVTFLSIGAAYFFYSNFISQSGEIRETDSAGTAADTSDLSAPNLAADNTIAVLPFTNMSGDASNEPFIMGMHDDLLTHLSRIKALKTTSRTSVGQYKDTTKNIREIAAELAVANILEGGIQRSGDRVRINMQLIDGRTDEHLWAEIYDRELTAENLFEVQAEIATAVTDALSATLLPEEQESLAVAPTQSLEAYDLYLAGRYHWYQQTAESAQQALEYFQQAIDADPDYVLALAGLADAYVALETYGNIPRQESTPEAQAALDHALSLDDSVSEVWAAQGQLRYRLEDYSGAVEALELAIELDPKNFWAWDRYGHVLYTLRRFSEALAAWEAAYALEPMFRPVNVTLAYTYRSRGNFKSAIRHFERADLLDEKDISQWKEQIAWTYYQSGELSRAIAAARRVLALDPANTDAMDNLVISYIQLGDLDEAELWAERAVAQTSFELSPVTVLKAREEFEIAIEYLEDWMERYGARPPSILGWAIWMAILGGMEETAEFYVHEYAEHFPDLMPPISPYSTDVYSQVFGLSWLINYEDRNDGRKLILRVEPVDVEGIRTLLEESLIPNLEYLMEEGYEHPNTFYSLAAMHVQLGSSDLALEYLATAVNGGLIPTNPLRTDPVFEVLQGDPRFDVILRNFDARMEEERSRLESMRLAAYISPEQKQVAVLSRQVIAQYEGYFTDDNGLWHFYLDEQGQFKLQVGQHSAPETLLASEDGVFFPQERQSYSFSFAKDDSGAVTHVTFLGDGGETRFKAAEPPPEAIALERPTLERYEGRYITERIKGAERENQQFDNWEASVYVDEAGELWLHFNNQPALVIKPFSENEFFIPGFMGFAVFAVEPGASQAHQLTMQWSVVDQIFKRIEQ